MSFEESPEALESAILSAGVALQPGLRSGRLRLLCRLPESTGADEHLFQHLQVIRTFQPDNVVIDAISACDRMGSGKAAFDYCMRLVSACKDRGITCILVNQMDGSEYGEDVSGLGLTSLVDTVIQLRFEVLEDNLQRSLVIRKARGCSHSPRVHDLGITDHGITIVARAAAPSAASMRPTRTTDAARAPR